MYIVPVCKYRSILTSGCLENLSFEKYVHIGSYCYSTCQKYLVSKVHSRGLCVYFFIDLKQVNQMTVSCLWLNKKDKDSDLPIYLPRG